MYTETLSYLALLFLLLVFFWIFFPLLHGPSVEYGNLPKKTIVGFLRKYIYQTRLIRLRFYGHKIGKDTFISKHAILDRGPKGFIDIGENCYITRGCAILVHSRAKMGGPRKIWSAKQEIKPVKIGKNVFLGWNTVILPGVTIGDNVIIGSMSLVNNDVPSGVVAAGVPAKVIKKVDETIND